MSTLALQCLCSVCKVRKKKRCSNSVKFALTKGIFVDIHEYYYFLNKGSPPNFHFSEN
jgi:hypothetical protein